MKSSPYSSTQFRRSAYQFLSGKVLSAILTFTILLYIVRVLPVQEYGAYVMLLASVELLLIIGSLGIPWLCSKYLPEYRLHASLAELKIFTWGLFLILAMGLMTAAFLFNVFIDKYFLTTGLSTYINVSSLILYLIVIEGLCRGVRDSILGSLMQQGSSRTSLILRHIVFLLLVWFSSKSGNLSLQQVFIYEVIASSVSVLVAIFFLLKYFNKVELKKNKEWEKVSILDMFETSLHMYFSHLLSLSYSPQLFLQLITTFLGKEVAALFGFVRNLYVQVSGYLPATLLLSVLRPKLVATYVGDGSLKKLNSQVLIAGKANLFILMPLISFSYVKGELLIEMLTGGRFATSGYILFFFLVALIPFSQRQLIETTAVVTGNSRLCLIASASGLCLLPALYILLHFDYGLLSVIGVIIFGQIIYNKIILIGMKRTMNYETKSNWMPKFILAAFISTLPFLFLKKPMSSIVWLDFIIVMSIILCLYLISVFFLKSFSRDEVQKIVSFTRGKKDVL